ncbi:MAG TPA: LysR family transcriptional regulator [Pseudomonadales bacterium]|jgi:DNA-binding transcriptional LysR family regulator
MEDPRLAGIGNSSINLKELRHVLLLHETLSFKRAAELAGVTQSALSQSIATLEERLGVKLFDRNRRKVSATGFGDLIAGRAVAILNDLSDMDQQIGAMRDVREGTMRFGMGIVPAVLILEQATSAFQAEHPDVATRVIVDVPEVLAERMEANEIEFFVAHYPPQIRSRDHQHETLLSYEHRLICAPEHPLAGLNRVTFADLIRHPVVSFGPMYLADLGLRTLRDSDDYRRFERNYPAVQTQQPWLLADLVAAGDFVMFAPGEPLADRIGQGLLVTREVADLQTRIEVKLVWKAGVSRSPAAKRMAEILHELAERQARDDLRRNFVE